MRDSQMEIVAAFPDEGKIIESGKTRSNRYAFPTLADGAIHKLVKGVDFDAETLSAVVGNRANTWAKAHGYTLKRQVTDTEVYVQFTKDPVAQDGAAQTGANPFAQ